MNLTARVKIDQNLIHKRLLSGTNIAQVWLDQQVKKDTDPYVPFRGGALSRSVGDNTPGSGELRYWAANKKNSSKGYARRQYYSLPHKNTAKHPKATMKWFEASKKVNQEKWLEGTKKMFKKGWENV